MKRSSGKGTTPKGWRLVRLGDVAEVVMGQSPPGELVIDWDGSDVDAKGLPFVQGNAEFGMKFPNPLKWCIHPFKVGAPGDILISVRAPVGATIRTDRELGIGRGLAAVRFSKLGQPCGWHMLNHAKEALERVTQGSTFQAIGGGELRNLPIFLPPLPEQRAIAAVLDSIDDAIERSEATIAATEQLRDSLLHQLLTRGVPGWHTEWKEAPGLGTIPAGWEVVRLGEVAEVERGKFAHRPRNEPQFYGGDIPFIQTGDVVRANRMIKQHSQTLNELGLSISRLFPAGTIIVTIAANIGETAIAGYPVAFPDSLVGVNPHGIDTNFLEYFLRTQKLRLNQFAPESAQKNITLEDLRPLSVPLPPLPEQQAIAGLLDGVDVTLERARTERDGLQLLKESAADTLLTGRVRVKL